MALTCYLEEFKTLQTDANGNILPIYPMPDAAQTLTINGTSALFPNPLNEDTKFIRIWSDASFYFNVGEGSPTAGPSTPAVFALVDQPRAVKVPSTTIKVAARTIAS